MLPVAFDKTGTLTVGKPRVTAIHPATGISESELLTLAAAVEQGATHPLAQAIVREAQVAELAIPPPNHSGRWSGLALKRRLTVSAC
ncbi:hypothetical protein ECZU34_26820 [Escherichia coli]|nr:hypothetical protein ECZU34_26820 [Escherichia coli]